MSEPTKAVQPDKGTVVFLQPFSPELKAQLQMEAECNGVSLTRYMERIFDFLGPRRRADFYASASRESAFKAAERVLEEIGPTGKLKR